MKSQNYITRPNLLMLVIILSLQSIINGQVSEEYPTVHKIKLVTGTLRSLLLLPTETNTVEVTGLEPGEKYIISFTEDELLDYCHPAVSMITSSGDLVLITNPLEFISHTEKLDLQINPACSNSYHSRLSLYISIARIDKKEHNINDQRKHSKRGIQGPLVAYSGISATELIYDIFNGDPSIQISNISSFGAPPQIGQFEGGFSSIGMENGVLISSGNCAVASGPNTAEGSGAGVGGGSDPDLVSLSGGASIFDAGGIEFDLISSASEIQFNYAFGSEEYEEYTCSQFNDQFGLFIMGPSLNKNLALIPSTNIPVKINTVNIGSVGSFGTVANCTPPFGSLAYSGFYVSNPVGSPDIQYDGFTHVLTAETYIIPNYTYHVKLVIGDAGDGVFDSGLFLEGKSLVSSSNYFAYVYSGSVESATVYESCNDAFIHFKRINYTDLDNPIDITLALDPGSTAIQGLDFDPLPSNVTIPVGEEEYILPVHIIDDGLIESAEIIKLSHNTTINGTSYTEIIIKDKVSLIDSSFVILSPGTIYQGIVINADTTLSEPYINPAGCSATHLTFIKVSNSVNDKLSISNIKAVPNPAVKVVTIVSDVPISINKWYLSNVQGTKIMAFEKPVQLPLDIDITDLPPGKYFWVGEKNGSMVTASFIKPD